MIAKQIKGIGFFGLVQYMSQKVNSGVGKLIDTNMLGVNPRELSKEFGIIRSLKPNLSKVVYHCALSIHPDEKLSDVQFSQIGQTFLNRMGFSDSQYLIYRHADRDHPHIHLISNRIDMNGKIVSDKWDYKRAEQVVRELEKEFGLKPVMPSEKVLESTLSKGQLEKYKRTFEIPIKIQLQLIVKEVLVKASSMNDFTNMLAEQGVTIKEHINSNNKVFGISYELDGVAFKGSALGKAYSWNNISKIIKNNYYERITGKSQTSNSRTESDVTRPGSETSGSEHREHSTTKTRTSSNFEGDEGANRYSNRSSSQISTTDSIVGKERIPGGATYDNNYNSIQRNEEVEFNPINQDNIDVNSFGSNNWVVDIPFSSSIANKTEVEDYESIRKKKKKGNNISM